MTQKIKSVEKDAGQGSIFFTTGDGFPYSCTVDEIRQEGKQVSQDGFITVYRGYRGENIIFEMGANIHVTVIYET